MEKMLGTNLMEKAVLRTKILGLEEPPLETLSTILNSPNAKDIENAIFKLKEAGALLQTCRGSASTSDGDLTFMGKVMNELPIDVKLTKLIFLGHLFDCFEEAVIIAAGSSIRNLFVTSEHKLDAYKRILTWADGSCSDQIALLNLYQSWQSFIKTTKHVCFETENKWCRENLINLRAIKKWIYLISELKEKLNLWNIKSTSGSNKIGLSQSEKRLVLQIIIVGAFFPNYFIHEPKNVHEKFYNAISSVGERNPFVSVYFTGVKSGQCNSTVKRMLNSQDTNKDNVVVGSDGVRVFAEFVSFESQSGVISVTLDGVQRMSLLVPGKIPYEVYEALRKRQLSFISEPSSAGVVCEAGDRNVFQEPTASLPSNGGKRYSKSRSKSSRAENYITLQISEFIDVGHFWAHTQKSMNYLSVIKDILNGEELCPITISENLPEDIELNVDQFYAARYNEDNLFYRCKIIAYENDWALIIFIDYGNSQQVTLQEIYYLPHTLECNLPPLSVECILQGIRPSPKCNPAGIWSERINNICKRQICDVLLYGKIHSIVDDLVYLEVYIKKPRGRNAKSVNDFLIEKGYAEPTEEYEKMKMFVEATVGLGQLEIAENFTGSSLQGPFSPLEIKFRGCTENFHNKVVNVDSKSVNTILLNNEPESCQTRMLAAGVVTGVECNYLNLNQTTLLPNIPGLPMIATLMFCPQMTLKLNQDRTKVVAILCGFGCYEATAQSPYPVGDLTLALDTVLTEVEIKKINKIRFHMNEAMTFMRDISEELATDHEIIRIQNCIKTELKELVNMQRQVTSRDVWSEDQMAEEILEPDLHSDPEDIWPLLQFARLNKAQDFSGNIAKNLDDLDRAARGDESTEGLECKLCQNPLGTKREVNRHLKSELHQKNIKEYYEKKFQL